MDHMAHLLTLLFVLFGFSTKRERERTNLAKNTPESIWQKTKQKMTEQTDTE